MTTPARELWRLAEPYHAVTYFAPEAHAAFEGAGLRGFWRGYFAGRAAPLGAVGPGVVTACFFGFHPDFVARALPSIWSIAAPDVAIEARLAGVDAAVRRIFGAHAPSGSVAEAAARLRDALAPCDASGRALFAANRKLHWPDEPHLALWHATTLLREHRGDGHVVALTAAGFGPCEAHVTQVAASGTSLDTIRPYRGWTDDDWQAATEHLQARGWLDDDGRLTPDGRAAREHVEHATDRLAAAPVDRLGTEGLETVLRTLAPLTAGLLDTGLMPYPNPIGVPAPSPR
ncbi:MAG: SCO6745 family protein [Acidimicrobiia bacterium]